MTMTINGSGSITGLSAGGLPDASITAADLASGAARANWGTGGVLQVVNATYNTQVSTSSTTYSDTGLTATITPSSASSKILVLISGNGLYSSTVSGAGVYLQAVRNSTSILQFEGIASYHGSTSFDVGVGGSSMSYLDNPATTSATTYKLQIATSASGKSVYINAFGAAGLYTASTITLMEIAG